MIKGILFDLDNTLTDFMTMKKRCTEAAISAMIDAGLTMSKRKAEKLLYEMYFEFGIEDHSIFQKFLKKYNPQKSNKIDYAILSAGIVAYRKVRIAEMTTYPHVRETLLNLREQGLKLGIVSDAPRLKAWLRLTEMNLVGYFDFVLGYEDSHQYKPSKVPFTKALKKMKLKHEEVVFLGDNPRRDIIGAKAMGIVSVLAKYGLDEKDKKYKKKAKANFEIKDIKNLLTIINKLNKD
jgi:HAD superfamily hydrolase (TIGR02253 family)